MITQPTQDTRPEPTLSDQADALDVLVALAESFPRLAAPYIMLHAGRSSTSVDLQIPTLADFETWRDALDADPTEVTLRWHQGGSWLSVDTRFLGVRVQLSAHGVTVPHISLVKAAAA